MLHTSEWTKTDNAEQEIRIKKEIFPIFVALLVGGAVLIGMYATHANADVNAVRFAVIGDYGSAGQTEPDGRISSSKLQLTPRLVLLLILPSPII